MSVLKKRPPSQDLRAVKSSVTSKEWQLLARLRSLYPNWWPSNVPEDQASRTVGQGGCVGATDGLCTGFFLYFIGRVLLKPIPTLLQTVAVAAKMISNLVTSPTDRGGGILKGSRAIGRIGQAVNVAVDRFVTVGETIADDNPEIKVEMYEACKEARAAGCAIEKLCETAEAACDHPSPVGVGGTRPEYRASMIRAARCLLSSVTRVLLLADTVVVKQLLLTQDKVSHILSRLESVNNFTEFVKAFSQFGGEMVELAQMTGDRQTDLKDDRRKAQMAAARQVLDRSTLMILTSAKVCLRHPECPTSRENRDTVFCQMRRAMDLIHYVVKDSVLDCPTGSGEIRMNGSPEDQSPTSIRREDWDANQTLHGAIRHLEDSVEMTRVTLCGAAVRERLCLAIDTISERSQDFTDSAYTSHEHRQTILLLLDRIKLELNHLLRVGVNLDQREMPSPSDELEQAISNVLSATKELKLELQNTALEQANEVVRGTFAESELISALKNAGLATDQDRLNEYALRFQEQMDHIQEVCKLLRHIATTGSLQVAAKYGEINLRIYGPQVITAAQTLCLYPTSKIAKENVEVFGDMWLNLVGDVKSLGKDVADQIVAENKPPEKHVYMSLPRPGKHGTTAKVPKPTKLDEEEQAKLAKSGLDMKMISSEVDQETEKWEERITQDEDNDIVKRAKNMSSMAFSMYQFTRGEGALKTTQDLFTQGEYFAEEANRLYKVVRQFSYQVPAGHQKKELMESLDQIPTYVQTLQFTVKNPTVGKAATFTKVDAVIQETKNLMNVISKVVTTCFTCATKFKLKMPERLELPTMDEVRATSSINPFGQVQNIFNQAPQTHTEITPHSTTHSNNIISSKTSLNQSPTQLEKKQESQNYIDYTALNFPNRPIPPLQYSLSVPYQSGLENPITPFYNPLPSAIMDPLYRWSTSYDMPLPMYPSWNSMYYPRFPYGHHPQANLQYLDLQSSILSPMSPRYTDGVLSYLSQKSHLDQNKVTNMPLIPPTPFPVKDTKTNLPAGQTLNIHNIHKDFNFSKLSN